MPIDLEWELSEAPDSEPNTSARSGAPHSRPPSRIDGPQPEPSRRRWPRWLPWAVSLVMLLSVAGAGLWQITRAGWREVTAEVVALARYEDELARQQNVALLLRVQSTADADWRQVRGLQAERGEPAPLPAPRLTTLESPMRVSEVVATEAGAVRADVYRQYQAPDGTTLTFRLPQFYRQDGKGDWERVSTPNSFWGDWLDWHSPHVQIRYAARDKDLVAQLGPELEARLSDACRLWGSLCAGLPPAKLFLSGFIGAVEYDPLQNIEVRVEFGPGPLGQTLPPDFFLSVPSPQIAGIPVDAPGWQYLADYMAVRLIASQAYKAAPHSAHALIADAVFTLGLRDADPGFARRVRQTAQAGSIILTGRGLQLPLGQSGGTLPPAVVQPHPLRER